MSAQIIRANGSIIIYTHNKSHLRVLEIERGLMQRPFVSRRRTKNFKRNNKPLFPNPVIETCSFERVLPGYFVKKKKKETVSSTVVLRVDKSLIRVIAFRARARSTRRKTL